MNWRGLCLELADRLAEHVAADDPLLIYAREGLNKPTPQTFGRGEKNFAAVLTPEKVRELRRLRADGMSYGKLAIRYERTLAGSAMSLPRASTCSIAMFLAQYSFSEPAQFHNPFFHFSSNILSMLNK